MAGRRAAVLGALLGVVTAAALVSGAVPTGTAAGNHLDVLLLNRSGRSSATIYVMLSGGSSSDGKLVEGKPRRLGDIAGSRFRLDSISAGRIFFSYDAAVGPAEPPRARTRYDKVELTYPGVANLTSVDFFAIPFRLEAFDANGKALGRLSFGAPTAKVRSALLHIKGARGALVTTRTGQFARVLSPQLSMQSYPSFRREIRAMAGKRVTLRGAFYGRPFQRFVYSGTFARDGSIELSGKITAPNGGSPSPARAVAVQGASLPRAVYTVDGPYTVGGEPAHVADNNVYSVIYRDLISGFAAGYMGGRYGNDSGRWLGKAPFAAARARAAPYTTYNEYAAVIYRYSDAYGFSFGDVLPKRVQLPLDRAAQLRVTILADR